MPRRTHAPLALALATALVALIGCVPSILPVTPSSATRIDVPPRSNPGDSTRVPEPATIEVRYYAHAPTVTIVGWDPTETAYGLRAWLRRDGSLIMDHRLYVSTYYTPARPVFTRAVTPSRPLELTGISRDMLACVGGRPCSPPETFGAFIPDALLRANRDSLAVTFYNRAGRELRIIIHRDLIDAYLGRLDSVVAVMRRNPSRAQVTDPQPAPTAATPTAATLFLINGKELAPGRTVQELDPRTITSVEHFIGVAALLRGAGPGRDVIVITTTDSLTAARITKSQ